MTSKKIYAIVLAVIGVIGEAYALITINADKTGNFWTGGYTYEPPFTAHEITYIAIAVISAIVIILSLVLLLKKIRKNFDNEKSQKSNCCNFMYSYSFLLL